MKTVFMYVLNLLSETILTILNSLGHNWIVLLITIITAVMMKTYVNSEKLGKMLLKKSKVSIIASVLIGAFTPFCACGTSAVILGMLTTTLPWAPIMAFLTSSPIMSPDGFILMSGVISLRFAIGLTAASLAIGLISGFLTHFIEKKTHFLDNQTRYSEKALSTKACSCTTSKTPSCSCGCSCDKDLSDKLSSDTVIFHEHMIFA